MATKQERERDEGNKDQEREKLNALIGERVIHSLGEPAGLREVQVWPLWEGHYRVNVLVGADAASMKVAHSYFLMADGDGNIVAATPRITRQY